MGIALARLAHRAARFNPVLSIDRCWRGDPYTPSSRQFIEAVPFLSPWPRNDVPPQPTPSRQHLCTALLHPAPSKHYNANPSPVRVCQSSYTDPKPEGCGYRPSFSSSNSSGCPPKDTSPRTPVPPSNAKIRKQKPCRMPDAAQAKPRCVSRQGRVSQSQMLGEISRYFYRVVLHSTLGPQSKNGRQGERGGLCLFVGLMRAC